MNVPKAWMTDEELAGLAVTRNLKGEPETIARAVCDILRAHHRMLINTPPEERGVIRYVGGTTAEHEAVRKSQGLT